MQITPESLRDEAVRRVKARNDLRTHAVSYLLINAMIVVLWAVTGAGHGWPLWLAFWPIYPILGWGAGLAIHAYTVFWGDVTEDQIQDEMRRLQR